MIIVLKWLYAWLFLLFLGIVTHLIIFIPQLWQVRHAAELKLFGYTFKNLYSFWGAYAVLLSFIYYPATYLFLASYWYGFNVVFSHKVWPVAVTSALSSAIVLFAASKWYFGELPAGNAIVAAAATAVAVAALNWK